MSRKADRSTKTAPKVLDSEARKRQLRHHLDSLERDNYVALNEYEAIIATAAAAASAQGPISLTHTNLDPLGLLPPLSPAVGSIVGGVVGTVGPGASFSSKTSGTLSGSRSKKNASNNNNNNNGSNSQNIPGNGGSASTAFLGHRKPVLPRKPLNQLLEESGLNQISDHASYVTASMGPSRYPERQFCTVCGWKGSYRCSRCGMRYCDLRCLKTHNDTRCMKFTI
ncbi:Zinc finger HIT domain-containing protein 1 [Mortierella antarctica]|nr:Zinc finger HIT domain-containing protein 1 [Mortierella alpina]KAF9988867.1 Zinc finger HIT domain-containing protein 1 [Mortierella antarctica]